MIELPFCPLPITHRARAYNKCDQHIDLAQRFREIREQRFVHEVGDDYDHCERTAYLESLGAFKE